MARSWFWRQVLSHENFNEKSIEKLIFRALGKILVLGAIFFLAKFQDKHIEKFIFPAFGKILVLARLFSYQNFKSKSIAELIFLAFGRWHGEIIRHSIFQFIGLLPAFWGQPMFLRTFCKFSSFWQDLGLAAVFSFQTKTEKYWEIDFSSFWQDLGFGGSFFLVKFQLRKVLRTWFFQLLARSWFWGQLFSFQISIQKVLWNWFF